MDLIELRLTFSQAEENIYLLDVHERQQREWAALATTRWRLYRERLEERAHDIRAYGQELGVQLLGQPEIREAWRQVRLRAQADNAPLRVSLRMPHHARSLHRLAWEALWEPGEQRPLLFNGHIWQSRIIETPGTRAPHRPAREQLRATVAVAGPRGQAEIDIDGEVARAQRALSGFQLTIVGDHQDATYRHVGLATLREALSEAPHLLYLVCRGRFSGEATAICFEDEQGEAIWIPAADLLQMIKALEQPPLLALLITGQGAGSDALAGLGPGLLQAGVPAALTFHGQADQRLMRRLLPALFQELRQSNALDYALAQARRRAADQDWWRAMLWLSDTDYQLWQETESFGGYGATFSGEPNERAKPTEEPIDFPLLRQLIQEGFSGDELKELCLDLDIDYESLPSQGKKAKVADLVSYMQRRNKIDRLLAECRRLRPNTVWPERNKVFAPERPPERAIHLAQAELAFEAARQRPNWTRVARLAGEVLAALPDDQQARRQMDLAGVWLDRLSRYETILRKRSEPGISVDDIGLALDDLERHWPNFDDPDGLREWVVEQRRLEKLGPALHLLGKRPNFHAALDALEIFLRTNPADHDATALVARIIERREARLEQRLRAAELAARFGDRRYPLSDEEWAQSIAQRSYEFGHPQGYWCYLPEGFYPGDEAGERYLRPFWIARYPLTMAQYQAFIDAGGYEQPAYWTTAGWAWLQEGRIKDSVQLRDNLRQMRPNQPMVWVSLDMARACCAWLNTRLKEVLTGYTIRLPRPAEWTAATCGPGGSERPYPWGDEPPDAERAIWQAKPPHYDRREPAPVGCCPAGEATCGALDLAGNIWELTDSSERAQAGEPEADTAMGAEAYVNWRGGSWSSSERGLRCAARDQTRRQNTNLDQGGFRLVLAPNDPGTN